MTKSIVTVAAVLALFVFGALPAMSDSENAAVVIKDGVCVLFNSSGALAFADGVMEVQTHGGTTVFICKAKGVKNDTGKAVRFDYDSTGYPCGTLSGKTNDWHETLSASGNATLVCKIHD